MTLVDYKIVWTQTQADGSTKSLLRFYEGAITTEQELNTEGEPIDVTRYRRSSVLEAKPLTLTADKNLVTEAKTILQTKGTPIDQQKP